MKRLLESNGRVEIDLPKSLAAFVTQRCRSSLVLGPICPPLIRLSFVQQSAHAPSVQDCPSSEEKAPGTRCGIKVVSFKLLKLICLDPSIQRDQANYFTDNF